MKRFTAFVFVGLLLTAGAAEAQRIRVIAKAGGVSLVGTAPTITLSSPANSATSVSINPTLSYTYTNSPTSCTLYFGIVNPPVTTTVDPTCSTFQPGSGTPLSFSTTYYWKVMASNSYGSQTTSVRSFTTVSSQALSLITQTDLSCTSVTSTPLFTLDSNTSGRSASTGGTPVALRYVGGVAHFFLYDAAGEIQEWIKPSGQACNTAPASLTIPSVSQAWGKFNVEALQYKPGYNSAYAYGLRWDETLSQLWLNWTCTYSNCPFESNSMAAGTFNAGNHTITTVMCGTLTNTPQPYLGTGTLRIPSDFVSANGLGTKVLAAGFGGGVASIGAGISIGNTLTAFTPTTNACAADTNYDIGTGTILARFPSNGTGPSCVSSISGSGLGCTPTTAPTTPYAGLTSLNHYSYDQYSVDWDCYNGQCYLGTIAQPRIDWYNDGVKHGIVSFFENTEGWINTTVASNVSVSYPSITFTSTAISTHDGNNLQVGDIIWVQTCTPGVETGCTTVNDQHVSQVTITAINTGTKVITASITSPDSGNGTHAPVIGGAVYAGVVYAHGSPTFTRGIYWNQIIDPSQLAEVIATTRQSYNVTSANEGDASTLIPGFGCPGCATAGVGNTVNHAVSSVIADPDHQRLFVVIHNATVGIGVGTNAIYEIAVAH